MDHNHPFNDLPTLDDLRQLLRDGIGGVMILSGPSGVGKDAILSQWLPTEPRVQKVVAWTTRPLRISPTYTEIDGVDYRFVSDSQFMRSEAYGGFLESEPFSTCKYGTPLGETFDIVRDNRIALLKIEVKGAKEVMEKLEMAQTVFVEPPSIEILKKHLKGRSDTADAEIERRLKIAEDELAQAHLYRYRIINEEGSVETTVGRLQEVFNKAFPVSA